MTSCAVMELGLKKVKNVLTSTPLAPSSSGNTTTKDGRDSCFSASVDGKENVDSGKQPHGWLAKVCNKFRNKQRRHEKCEKCGQKSDTCLANPSFISGRKHYLCEDCRVSSGNMKNMYHQLYRNLSLRDPPRMVCNSGDLTPPSSSRGVVRSRSMRTRPTAPESGYDTATSLDSSCSNGRLSPDPVCMLSGACGLRTQHHTEQHPRCAECNPSEVTSSAKDHMFSKDRSDVFGGAFKSEKDHLREIRPQPKTKVYTRQPPPPSYQHPGHQQPHTHQKAPLDKDTVKYDGYLQIRTPNSQGVKYVFKQKKDRAGAVENDEVQSDHLSRRRYSENLKLCYRCNKFRCIAFRAPFGNGWLCEDCMDDLM